MITRAELERRLRAGGFGFTAITFEDVVKIMDVAGLLGGKPEQEAPSATCDDPRAECGTVIRLSAELDDLRRALRTVGGGQ